METFYSIFAVIILVSCSTAHGYRKYQSIEYDYKISDTKAARKNKSTIKSPLINEVLKFSPSKADYVLKDNKGSTFWVQLSLSDKRHLRDLRKTFDVSTPVTHAMIMSFLHSRHRKTLGLTLRDFQLTHKDAITIGYILHTLNL